MSKTKQQLIDSTAQVLEDQHNSIRPPTLVNWWFPEPASGAWVKPDWPAIARIAVEDVLFELGMDDIR